MTLNTVAQSEAEKGSVRSKNAERQARFRENQRRKLILLEAVRPNMDREPRDGGERDAWLALLQDESPSTAVQWIGPEDRVMSGTMELVVQSLLEGQPVKDLRFIKQGV